MNMRSEIRFLDTAILAIAFASVLSLGCVEQADPTGSLRGTVFSNGEVVGDCLVYLTNKPTKRTIGGTVDSQGKFEITGIPLGECVVAVSQQTSSDPNGPPFDERIPVKFRVTNSSGFKVDIKEGDNELDLKMMF